MNIVEVKQNLPKDFFRIDLYIGNICNYKCWYCFPGCNDATFKWPDFDLYVKHVSYILDYYLEHTDKKKFQIHLMGGEVTHWPKFGEFIEYFKSKYNCVFSLATNASKKLDWWKKFGHYLDRVSISHHQAFSDIAHNREVADYLYSKSVLVNIQIMMDPFLWDECLESIAYYKASKHKWGIRYIEVLQDKIPYTTDQKNILNTLMGREPNPFWFLRVSNIKSINTYIIDDNGKKHKVHDQQLTIDRLNEFTGWECNLGVDWINVKFDGSISGICGNKLYATSESFNIFDPDFMEKFQPQITKSICQQSACWCTFETNMPKKKIIPIYAS
jgi:MoaA/NifB/PqqE/SkfB family radical SAM enzyme